jgi:hypothetical protein
MRLPEKKKNKPASRAKKKDRMERELGERPKEARNLAILLAMPQLFT